MSSVETEISLEIKKLSIVKYLKTGGLPSLGLAEIGVQIKSEDAK